MDTSKHLSSRMTTTTFALRFFSTKPHLLFSRVNIFPVAIFACGFIVQVVLITQLYFSFVGTGLAVSTTATAATKFAQAQISYHHLATVIQERISQKNEGDQLDRRSGDILTISELEKILSNLASNQQTFKGLDGVAHEAYQRTHSGGDVTDTSVSGRAQRSASRLAAVAEALHACELVEMIESSELCPLDGGSHDEILHRKEIILNVTLGAGKSAKLGGNASKEKEISLSVLVLYEPYYAGGMGLEHGSLQSLKEKSSDQSVSENENGEQKECLGGRLLVVLGQKALFSKAQRIQLLDETPQKIKLSSGLVTNEVASVQPELYRKAGELLTLLEPQLRRYNTSSFHFVGHSLAGGVASLAATILDGSIPMPKGKKKKKTRKKNQEKRLETVNVTESVKSSKSDSSRVEPEEDHDQEPLSIETLNGLGRARTSALSLGSPPCLSSNVLAAFCTSFIYGDDVICRTTKDSISRLTTRVEKTMHVGFIGKKLGWMSDTVSLTVSSLQNHAHGSEGEETRLSIPGRSFLVRPRRLGGMCSIHEVGNLKKGGREALREALLWQMNDVLLSTSMWKHHELTSYIQGLDRTQLRGVADDEHHIQ